MVGGGKTERPPPAMGRRDKREKRRRHS